MKRRALVLLALLPVALGGCSLKIPGVTYSSEVTCGAGVSGLELASGGKRLAYCIQTSHLREPTLAAIPDGGTQWILRSTYEVYTYDLTTRELPKLVGRWRRHDSDRYSLWLFDGVHAVLAVDDGQAQHYIRINTLTGERKPVSQNDEPAMRSERERLHPGGPQEDKSPRRFHLEYSYGEFLLWDPAVREFEHLFELPRAFEGDSVSGNFGMLHEREQMRRANTIHRTWDCTARSEKDSVYVTLETYVPQPGQTVRAYRFWYSLSVPAQFDKDTFGNRDSLLLVVDRRLGPRGVQVTQAFATENLARVFAPQGRLFQRGMAHTGIKMRFAPLPLPGDKEAGYPGIYDGDIGEAGVGFMFR